jgi:uncharacterized protein YbjQ (UPF0145 family)
MSEGGSRVAVTFKCTQCGNDIAVRFLSRGERAQCKSCGSLNPVPQTATPVEGGSEPNTPGASAHSTVQPPVIPLAMTTTTVDIPGFQITRSLGVVRGLTVRSRSIIADLGAQLESMVGGKVTAYVKLCEQTRAEAFDLMLNHAHAIGANAVIGMRFDANEVSDGITEVLCYGTAVVVEKTR